MFETFDENPLAAASIAQVHTARLRGGQDVVVKVLRPGVREAIERDLEVMYVLARFARDHFSEGHRLRPLEVVREYEKTILDELDLMREAGERRAARGAISPARRCSTCPRCTGTTAAPTSWSWSASMAC